MNCPLRFQCAIQSLLSSKDFSSSKETSKGSNRLVSVEDTEMFSDRLRSLECSSRSCLEDSSRIWTAESIKLCCPDLGVMTRLSRSSSNRLGSKVSTESSSSSRCRFRSDVRRIAPKRISDFSSGGGSREVGRCSCGDGRCCCCWWSCCWSCDVEVSAR